MVCVPGSLKICLLVCFPGAKPGFIGVEYHAVQPVFPITVCGISFMHCVRYLV